MTRPMGEGRADSALEIGECLAEPPSRQLIQSAFDRELHSQLCLARAVNWADLAHTLVLADRGVIPESSARALLAALLELEAAPPSFAPSAEFGDLYTNREAWLAERTEAAGWLGVARARREALTTAWHLVVCEELLNLGEALAAMARSLIAASLKHRDTLVPDYTYLQAAEPTTFGHYLQSFAWPILRDFDRIAALHGRVDRCPAGIGSANGSVTMQDRRAQASMLGFREPVRHARDAMWQPDLAMESVNVAVMATVNLDRLAEDLLVFASAEFGFIHLADRHARASKIMPQKKNPFALAFLRATANRLIGLQAGTAAASRTLSGQVDNRIFTYGDVPDALRSAAEAVSLLAECLDGLSVDTARAAALLDDRSTCAADLAERLMAEAPISYRDAHGVVGRLIHALGERGRSLADATPHDVLRAFQAAGLPMAGIGDEVVRMALDPAACIAARTDIGGAAAGEVTAMAEALAAAVDGCRPCFRSIGEDRKAAIGRLLAKARARAGGAG